MSKSIWHGDKQNGVELRQYDGEEQLDEIVVYVDGKVILHVEQMSDQNYWMGIYVGDTTVHANCGAKHGRAHVSLTAEGW